MLVGREFDELTGRYLRGSRFLAGHRALNGSSGIALQKLFELIAKLHHHVGVVNVIGLHVGSFQLKLSI